jgi:ABC-type amino acid transport system permease subunit
LAIALATVFRVWAHRRQDRTGAQSPTVLVALALFLGVPALVFGLVAFTAAFIAEIVRAGVLERDLLRLKPEFLK